MDESDWQVLIYSTLYERKLCDNKKEEKFNRSVEDNSSRKSVKQVGTVNSKEKPITVEDSDEDDFSAWSDLDDDILISEGN